MDQTCKYRSNAPLIFLIEFEGADLDGPPFERPTPPLCAHAQQRAAGDRLPLSTRRQSYPGSRTTPPCSETVEWLLLTDPIHVADAEIAGFAKLHAMNARPAQKANRRAVLGSG